MKVDAISLDAAGTLIRLTQSVGQTYADVATEFGGEMDPDAVDAAFRKAWSAMPPQLEAPGPLADDGRAWWRALVDRVFDTHGVGRPPADRAGCFARMYDRFAEPGVWEPYEETRPALESLASRWPLVVLSNFDRRLHRVLRDLDLTPHFQAVLVSSQVGAPKPSPRMFRAACEAADCSPAGLLHVGDSPTEDWAGARACGIRAFELHRPHGTLSDLVRELSNDAS